MLGFKDIDRGRKLYCLARALMADSRMVAWLVRAPTECKSSWAPFSSRVKLVQGVVIYQRQMEQTAPQFHNFSCKQLTFCLICSLAKSADVGT